jgi:hypothetical protein
VLLFDPVLIAGLLVGTVWIAAPGGHRQRRRTWLLTGAAVLVAPALYSAMFALSAYDDAAGLITARQYVDVRVGQTRSAVHDRLGREGDDLAYAVFQPGAPGSLCDYYRNRFWTRLPTVLPRRSAHQQGLQDVPNRLVNRPSRGCRARVFAPVSERNEPRSSVRAAPPVRFPDAYRSSAMRVSPDGRTIPVSVVLHDTQRARRSQPVCCRQLEPEFRLGAVNLTVSRGTRQDG